jgi:hypothetical protein
MSRLRINVPNPEIIERRAAADLGRARFYTGKPCKRGHLTQRFVSSGGCVECVNPARRAVPDGMEIWRPAIPLGGVALSGEDRNKLEALIAGWVAHTLREWGQLP